MRYLALLLVLVAVAGSSGSPMAAEPKPTWDQVTNIRQAAERIAKVQRGKGATAAYTLIDACYRTHGLSEKYGAGFEGCIAQDYIQTKTLARIYTRVEPDVLKKLGAPSADALAQAMGRRIASAFAQYKVPAPYMERFKTLVDQHGVPAFMKIVFPNAGPGSEPEKSPQPAPAAPSDTQSQPEKK